MKQKELYKAAQLLKAGQIVELEGDCFRAIQFLETPLYLPCDYCTLDSICKGDIHKVCDELNAHGQGRWLLRLAHEL